MVETRRGWKQGEDESLLAAVAAATVVTPGGQAPSGLRGLRRSRLWGEEVAGISLVRLQPWRGKSGMRPGWGLGSVCWVRALLCRQWLVTCRDIIGAKN